MSNITRTDIVDPSEQPAPILPESNIPVIQEYKGNPLILLNPDSKWPFSFGIGKAKMVLNNISFIQRFVDSNGASVE